MLNYVPTLSKEEHCVAIGPRRLVLRHLRRRAYLGRRGHMVASVALSRRNRKHEVGGVLHDAFKVLLDELFFILVSEDPTITVF